jgi:hypothetical protein
MASNVLTLNSSVPTNWTKALHQVASWPQRRPRLTVTSRSSRLAAKVKNTAPSAPDPTSSTKPGNGPMRKQADPMAKPSAMARSQAARVAGRGDSASA